MIQPVFSVRDEVADFFGQPFVDNNEDSVKRSFKDAVLSGKINHAGDYSVYRLGEYDNKIGLIVPLGTPKLVVRGSQIINEDKETNNEVQK